MRLGGTETILAEEIQDGDEIGIPGSKLWHHLSSDPIIVVVAKAVPLERHIEIRRKDGTAFYMRRDERVELTHRQGRLF